MCEGERMKRGTKWRGREPMKPNLIREPMQTWLKMYMLCVHLRWRRVPTDPRLLRPLRPRTPCQYGWLLRPLLSRKGISQLGIPK